jgi:cytidine deaminase
MLRHPELLGWLKCVACGFCRQEETDFIQKAKEVMEKHKGTLKKLKDSGD